MFPHVLSGFVVRKPLAEVMLAIKKLVTWTQLFASQAAEVLDVSCHLHQTCLHQVLQINLILQLSLLGVYMPLGVLQWQREKKKSRNHNNKEQPALTEQSVSLPLRLWETFQFALLPELEAKSLQ